MAALQSTPAPEPADLADVPEPARRYLRHALSAGAPLASACTLSMSGSMTPRAGAPPIALTAEEWLAPEAGFLWVAHARMYGLPVRVSDDYHDGAGGVGVKVLGLIPIPFGGHAADLARSARGRLVAEAVWCPGVLAGKGAIWKAVDSDRAQYTLVVDGEPVSAIIHVDPEGALLDVQLQRWGNPDGGPFALYPYGFRVHEEATYDGTTIPTRLTGGWLFGTDAFDSTSAATFVVHRATFGSPSSP